ncbi:MAG: diphthine--ammonia ligase [Methanomassiliicoccaceae archaeon]|jgi:ABC transporter with metal-binding/Fe-S-binding domain ATP-binding protein|nr:diphthine--ammonia ligase [Methanomassiliicoccaceae archaeon]
MRLASLYSGGKDSTLAMYLAEQMGHTVECMVSIVPYSGDSMMFHVPNTHLVPLLAGSMGKRLVTVSTGGNEDEDMDALHRALSGLDIDGVVTGAVWSDYQWDRMNRVCGSLGLVCLAPLWRKDQEMIMDELMDSDISSVIVGVFAEGLDVTWLGRSVSDSYEQLKIIGSKNHISIIGEGGEFETLTLDSPMQTSVLEIEHAEKDWNGHRGTLNVKRARLVRKGAQPS